MKRILPFTLAHYALIVLMFAVAISGVAHRFDAKAASAAQSLALSGFTLADICGGDTESVATQGCQACIFSAGLGMPPQKGASVPLCATSEVSSFSAQIWHIVFRSKHHLSRAPPHSPFA